MESAIELLVGLCGKRHATPPCPRGPVRAHTPFLEYADYEVTEASSGWEALEAAETLTPDLVMCAINMPGMDGIRTVESLLRIPLMRQIPVIFISGLASDEQRRRIAALGAYDLLTKPFSIHELLELVRKHLDIPGA
jgi:CheY-like chemotaxis protein